MQGLALSPIFLSFNTQNHAVSAFSNPRALHVFCLFPTCFLSQPTFWCWLLWLSMRSDVEAESWKHPERSYESGRQAVLLGSQMPQSACRAQTLQECTNKARLKPLYSQDRLEKRAKVIKIMQPVLHERGLLPTSQITHHLKASNQGVEWFTGSYFSFEVPGISCSSWETGTYYISIETTSESVCTVHCKQKYNSLYWKPTFSAEVTIAHLRPTCATHRTKIQTGSANAVLRTKHPVSQPREQRN